MKKFLLRLGLVASLSIVSSAAISSGSHWVAAGITSFDFPLLGFWESFRIWVALSVVISISWPVLNLVWDVAQVESKVKDR